MAKLGLKGLAMGVDKGWDLIPDKYFGTDAYKKAKKKKNHLDDKVEENDRDERDDQRHKSRRNRSRRSSDPGRGSAIKKAVPSAGLAGAVAQQNSENRSGRRDRRYSDDDSDSDDNDYHDRQQRGQPGNPQQQQQHQSDFVSQGPDPQNHPEQGWIPQNYYQPPTYEYNTYNPSLQQAPIAAQGDPNFPYTAQHTNPLDTQPPYNPAYNPYANPYTPPPPIQDHTENLQPPTMGDNYQQYNPARYQPKDYQNSGGERYNDRYDDRITSSRYNQSEQGGGGRAGRYDDDYSDDDRDYERAPARREKSKPGKGKSREQSQDGGPVQKVKGAMHEHLDDGQKGIAAAGIGALAGGLLGHKFGKGPIATVAGVLIGGVGANAWEAHESKSKEKKSSREKEKKSSRRAKSSSGRSEAYSSKDSYDDRRGYDSAEDGSDDSYYERRPARREKESKRDSRRYERSDSR